MGSRQAEEVASFALQGGVPIQSCRHDGPRPILPWIGFDLETVAQNKRHTLLLQLMTYATALVRQAAQNATTYASGVV